ncbi:MAG: hypothetical protein MZV70_13215 [Desulfobacterales bacterium]|nr:hypothetical protein [Desulfobacterales bacterium]
MTPGSTCDGAPFYNKDARYDHYVDDHDGDELFENGFEHPAPSVVSYRIFVAELKGGGEVSPAGKASRGPADSDAVAGEAEMEA